MEIHRADNPVLVSESTAELKFHLEVPLPVEVAWEYFQRPRIKAALQGASEVRVLRKPSGRTGVGTVYHCAHGAQSTRQTIVDWRPYDYFTVQDVSGFGPVRPAVLSSYIFEPIDPSNTRITFRMGRPRQVGPLRGAMVGLMWEMFVRNQLAGRLSFSLKEQILEEIRSDQDSGLLWSEVEPPE